MAGPNGGGYITRGCIDEINDNESYTSAERAKVCSTSSSGTFPQTDTNIRSLNAEVYKLAGGRIYPILFSKLDAT
jgi:hypothetical protein